MKASPNTAAALNKLTSLIKLGTINTRLSKQTAADQRFKEAEAVATGPTLELSDFDAFIRIGASFNRADEKQQREKYFQQAIHVAAGSGREAEAYRLIANSFAESKAYTETIEYLKKAADGYAKDDAKLAQILRNIGSTYEVLGRKEDAVEYYTRAKAVYERLKAPGTVNGLKYKIDQLSTKK